MKANSSSQHRLPFRRRLRSLPALVAAALSMAQSVSGQLLYTEDFNTDGDGTRYTTKGRGLVLLTIEGNQEPSYWTHSSDVTKAGEAVGVVVPAAARRAVITYQSAVPEALLTPEALKLIDNTIKWLTEDKKGKVIFSPSASGEGDTLLSQRLTSAGYTVADDDTAAALPDAATLALAISTSAALPAPTRFTRYAAPMLTFNAANHDDELTTSIGASNSSFDPGEVTIADTSHPIAAGLPKTFKFVTEAVGLDTVGTTLPEKAKVIATYKFLNPDTGLEETRPLLVVVEKGDGLLGGAFKGFEGSGFWAGADMNEPTITPDCCASVDDPRQLTLKAANVAGKKDLRVTIALAATDIDFETSDFLRVMIDPDGAGPAEFTQIVNFTPPSGNDKFFADPAGKNRLGAIFRDVEFKIPDGATDLVVRIEAMSTFFNEIVGFDNIRIHSGPLPVAPPETADVATGLIGYWPMNETSGTVVPDSSGKGHNGAIINSPTATWVTDAERGAVYRSTGTSVISFGELIPPMTTANDFTWSLWLKSDETGTAAAADNNIVFGNRYNAKGAEFSPREFIKFTPSNFEWHFNAAGQNVDYTDFVVGKWTHHVVVKKGSTLTYYRDGVEAKVGTITGGPKNAQPLYLGGQGTQERWKGAADEVAIYSRALSPTDVKQVFDLGKANQPLVPPPVTIASLKVDGSSLVFTWTGGQGPFKVQRRDDIASGNWTDVATVNDRTASVTVTGNTGFFRVIAQ